MMCPICGRRFKGISSLKKHAKYKHLSENRCPACGRKFLKVQSLALHLASKKEKCDKHLVVCYLFRRPSKMDKEEQEKALDLIKKGFRV